MRKFGLIGYPLGHSFSMKYFSGKFQRESISDCQYSNFEIPSITQLPELLEDPELEGLNITIPYKVSSHSGLPDQVLSVHPEASK